MLTPNSLGPRTLLLGAALLGACAARARVETLPRRYDCDGTVLVRRAQTATLAAASAPFVRHDQEGDHYVVATVEEAAEYVLPDDRRQDAEVRKYEVIGWGEGIGWIPRGKGVCRSVAGYTDALERFINGASTGEVARQLALDPAEARELIGQALTRARLRYHEGP